MKQILVLTACMVIFISPFSFKMKLPFSETSVSYRADLAGMTEEDFIFISSVT